MKLCWLRMLFFLFSANPTYLRRAVWLPDHLDGNPCEDIFWDQWHSLNLDRMKESLEHVCKCHADRCVYIAVLHTFKQAPVYWAYQIHHEEATVLLDGEFPKNFWTWYIPPKVIGAILQGKLPTVQQAVLRLSLPITHIVSGVLPAKKEHISKSNWPKKDCIHWIAYNHTGTGGVTFDGAAIQDGYQWKQLSVVQLADMLSRTYSTAKLFRTLSGYQKVRKPGLEILPKEPAFTYYKKPSVGKMLHGQEERIPHSSLEVALEMDDRKSGQEFVEQEDTSQLEQDIVDGSESPDIKVELTGEVLGISQDTAVPEEPWLDLTEKTQDSSKHDIVYRQYDAEVSMTDSENGREQGNKFLGIFREIMRFWKTRPQREVVPSSPEAIPKGITTEVTIKVSEAISAPETPTTMGLETKCTEEPTTTKTDKKENHSKTTVAFKEDHSETTEAPKKEDHSETTVAPKTTKTVDGLESKWTEERVPTLSFTQEPNLQTFHEVITAASIAEVTVTESSHTECIEETQTPPNATEPALSAEPGKTTHVPQQSWESAGTSTTVGLKTEYTEETMTSTATKKKDQSETTVAPKTEDQSETTVASKTEDHSETTVAPKTENHSETTVAPKTENHSETTVALKIEDHSETTVVPKTEDHSETTVAAKTKDHSETTLAPKTEDHSETTLAPKTEDHSETTLAPKTEDHCETTVAPKIENHSETTVVSKTEDHNETTMAPKTEDHIETTVTTKTEDHSETTVAAKTEDHIETTVAPKTEDHCEITVVPKTNDHSETTVAPKTEDHSETTVAPKTENHCETTMVPKTEDHSETTVAPTTEDHSETTVTPRTEDHCETTMVPKTEDHSETTMVPKTENHSKTTMVPKTEDHSETTVAPKTEDHSETTMVPKTENHSKTTMVPKTEDHSETTVAPTTEDHSETTVTPRTEDHCETTMVPKTEDHSETTVAPKIEDHSETTVVPKTTKTAEVLETTSIPEITSTESLGTECTEVTQTPPYTTNEKANYTESAASPEPGKTTHVLETKNTEETPLTLLPTLGVHSDTTTPTLPDVTTEDLGTECTEVTETSSDNPGKWPCYGLIHRTTAAFKRCWEKLIALLKLQKTTPRPHLSSTDSSDLSSTHSTPSSQKPFQLPKSSDTPRDKNYFTRSHHIKLKDEDNEHFYYFDGKVRRIINQSGPMYNL